MYTLFLAILVTFMLNVSTTLAFAADCPVVYGGGPIDCAKITVIPTAVPTASPTPTSTPVPNQTKGGLIVQPKTEVTTTPATGPEAFALVSLIPMAAAGLYLRRKTK